MLLDRVLALLALAGFVATVGIVVVKVGRVDLGAVIAIVLAMVCYDLWLQLFTRRR
jgi:hypothetical protein